MGDKQQLSKVNGDIYKGESQDNLRLFNIFLQGQKIVNFG